MVKVSFDFRKRDFVWLGLVVILLSFGIVYVSGTSDPTVMGHTLGEIEFPGCDSDSQVLKYWGGEWICDDDNFEANTDTQDTTTHISGGMYGYCKQTIVEADMTILVDDIIYPASVAHMRIGPVSFSYCSCRDGYTKVLIGGGFEVESDGIRTIENSNVAYWSCLKN